MININRPAVDTVCVASPKEFVCAHCGKKFKTTTRFAGGRPCCQAKECKRKQVAEWHQREKDRLARKKKRNVL